MTSFRKFNWFQNATSGGSWDWGSAGANIIMWL